VLTGGLVVGGTIGIVAELGFLGGLVVASDPTYCDCDFADIQLIERSGLLDLVSTVQIWLLAGFLILFGAGLFAALRAARESPGVPRGWASLTALLAAVLVVVAIWVVGFPLLANALALHVDVNAITGLPSLIVLMILVPWWALWLRAWLRDSASSTE